MQAADIMAVGCLWLPQKNCILNVLSYACSLHTTMCVCIKSKARVFDMSVLCVAGAWLVCLLGTLYFLPHGLPHGGYDSWKQPIWQQAR